MDNEVVEEKLVPAEGPDFSDLEHEKKEERAGGNSSYLYIIQ